MTNLHEEELQAVSGGTEIPYLVKPGDTIGKLAKRFHCTEEQICRWNKIRLTDPLLVGQKLVLRF